MLPNDFRLRWRTVWMKDRISKEAGLLWLVWHRAVAVNFWRGRYDATVDISCAVCTGRPDESVLHRFWGCVSAQRAWEWAMHILNTLVHGKEAEGPWQMVTWKNGIFSCEIPRKFNQFKRVWMELRTVVLWALWIERNDKVFNDVSWPPAKLMQVVWDGIIDYGRIEWTKVKLRRISHPDRAEQEFAVFQARRGRHEVFAEFTNEKPRWQLRGPVAGFVSAVR